MSKKELSAEALEARRSYQRNYYKNLTAEQKERRRASNREWQRKNPDKMRAIVNRYWSKKAVAQSKTTNTTQA